MEDPTAFGKTLSRLMKEAKLTRRVLAERMHVSVALIDKWKSTSARKTQHRRPGYEQMVQLIEVFSPQLDAPAARQWAAQANHHLPEETVTTLFPPLSLLPPPQPNLAATYGRLEPLPPHRLFDIEAAQGKLLQALDDPDDVWLLAINGIGGIGKTALANLLVRALLSTSRFYDVLWLSVKQEEFKPQEGVRPTNRPALEVPAFTDRVLEQLDPTLSLSRPTQEKAAILMHWLKSKPYLVVIDNLETVVDYQTLIPTLRRLARPTKILLTSREQVDDDLYHHNLGEISQPAAMAFLHYMAERHDIGALRQAEPGQIQAIYEVVGGNPLALKLVTGQIRSGLHSLSQILENLRQARGKTIDQLYTFIYWQAWQALDEAARRLFVLMPQLPNADREDLARKSKLSDEALTRAVRQLTVRSLIEVRGDLEQPTYYLHRLTETFLLNEVIQWKRLT